MSNLLPCIGGFNDGKYIEPNGREVLKMAKPSDYPSPPGIEDRHNDIANFDYEIYYLSFVRVGGKNYQFFLVEGFSKDEAMDRLIGGYKQFSKKKKA